MSAAKQTTISWASFVTPIRLGTGGGASPAVIATAAITLTKDVWEGIPVLVVNDAGANGVVRIPFTAIASFA